MKRVTEILALITDVSGAGQNHVGTTGVVLSAGLNRILKSRECLRAH